MNTKFLPVYSAQIARTLLDSFKVLPIIEDITKNNKLINDCIANAYKAGYFISPECACEEVFSMLRYMDNNYNSTFYKSWTDIAEKGYYKLLIDQIIHYMSTYGTEYSGKTYIPNDNPLNIPYSELVVIPAISVNALAQKCYTMACSGVALTDDMITAILWVMGSAIEQGYTFDLNKITNRELMARLHTCCGVLPDDSVEALRVLIYIMTGSTLLIKNRETFAAIRLGIFKYPIKDICVMFNISFDDFVEKFAPIFYRFKPLFLMMKNNNQNIINRLRRKAVKLHQPLIKGFFENITSVETSNNYPVTAVTNIIKNEKNTFKLIRAASVVNSKLMKENLKVPHVYIIRNGKSYTKSSETPFVIPTQQKKWFQTVHQLLIKEIINRVSENIKSRGITDVILPNNLHLACPISEKMFFGNIPYGSYYNMLDSNNFFGVYWRNEWGTHDFDLSFSTIDTKFGWDGSYRNDESSLFFSGDMTNADPEATEMFYAPGNVPNGIIKLNRYNGDPGSKAELFFGQEKIANLERNYMVNPDNVCVRVPIVSTLEEQAIGLIYDNKIYFIDIKTGYSRVSSIISPDALESLKIKLTNVLFINDVLKGTNVNVITTGIKTEIMESPNVLDLRDIDKEKIISLFLCDK